MSTYYYKSDLRTLTQFKKKKSFRHIHSFNRRVVRFVMLLVILSIIITLSAMMHANATSDQIVSNPTISTFAIEHHTVIDVKQGDTLWGIAKRHAPETMDIRKYIYEVRMINGLPTSSIHEGQALLLP